MKHNLFQERINFINLSIMFIAAVALSVFSMKAFSSAAPTPMLEGRYIVVLKDSVQDSKSVAEEHRRTQNIQVTSVYNHALKGFAAKMTPGAAQVLQHDPRVAYVEVDGVAKISATQTSAPWGLDRIDQRNLPLNGSYTATSTGTGVKAYVIDTGVRKTHADFSGRVTDGFDAVDNTLPAQDCNGHGSHVAGTVGGTTYGVAKNTSLVAVRVLDCEGSGYWSWIIAGIDYVTADHQPGQPAVANMSLGGNASSAVDTAVRNSIADGVTYVVAAGNSSQDACRFSPARVSEAITIGAADNKDSRPSWSNWGSCVDFFAPGVSIASVWNTSDSATNIISGTSMASPHAAGVAALYLQDYAGATPSQVRTALYNNTTKSVVSRSKSVNNHLLFTNY